MSGVTTQARPRQRSRPPVASPQQPHSGRRSVERAAVLHLTHEGAEWFDDGDAGVERFGSAQVLGPSPSDLVAAAQRAREDAGAPQRPCVLVLGGKLTEQRLLTLPPLGRRELPKVLARKAANLLGVELDDALYAALPLAADSRESESEVEQRWYVFAMRRSLVAPLAEALQRAHLRVARLSCATLARLCAAQEARGDVSEPCIVIDVDFDSVVVSLIHAEELRMQNRIQGTFRSAPTMALSLIQEVRSFDAYWRKSSRGEGVSQVVVIGVESERARLFAHALTSALPHARVVLRPEPGEEGAAPKPNGARIAALRACRSTGAFQLEANLPAPPRTAVMAAVAGCALLVASGVGAVLHQRMSHELVDLRSSAAALAQHTCDLERLREGNRRAEALAQRAALEAERLAQARELGAPLAESIETLLAVVERRAELRSFSLSRFAGEGELRFAAVSSDDPVESVRDLKTIEHALASSPLFHAVEIETPALRREIDSEAHFNGRAAWEAAR